MPERRFELISRLSARGLPGASPETLRALADIIDEGVLGASNHVALALPLIATIAAERTPSALEEALETARFIAETRGAGAPIVANALWWQIAGVDKLERAAAEALLRERARRWADESVARRGALVRAAAEHLAAVRALLLFDYSSTVADVVIALSKRDALRLVILPESRAVDGGRRYLEAFAICPQDKLFVPDAAIDWAVAQAGAVLLGAESLSADGGIVNTIGSVPAARAAAARNIPVYGVADLFKVGPDRAADMPKPALRSYPGILPPGCEARSDAPELEIVPADLVSAILTERGAIKPAELAGAVATMKETMA